MAPNGRHPTSINLRRNVRGYENEKTEESERPRASHSTCRRHGPSDRRQQRTATSPQLTLCLEISPFDAAAELALFSSRDHGSCEKLVDAAHRKATKTSYRPTACRRSPFKPTGKPARWSRANPRQISSGRLARYSKHYANRSTPAPQAGQAQKAGEFFSVARGGIVSPFSGERTSLPVTLRARNPSAASGSWAVRGD